VAADVETTTHIPARLGAHELVLLHGQPGSAADWLQVAGRLPAQFHAVAVDRPVYGSSRRPAADIDLPSGSVLALYTDGLIERPGQDIGAGMSRLARALAGPARSLDDLCDSVLASLAPGARDDIALLLARTTAEPAFYRA
jgi:pimeloyl-ACP methyl ester carboxylesterase